MVDSIVGYKDIKKADAIVLGVPFGETFSYRNGSEKGPREVINCLHRNLEFFDRFTRNEPAYMFKISHDFLGGMKNISAGKMIEKVADYYAKRKNQFILMLGGSHSVSIGVFSHFSKKYKPKGVTILQIDAHPDLRDETSDYKEKPDKFDDSCVMRRAVDFGFKTVQVGIRTYSVVDYKFMKKNRLTIFEWGKEKVPTIRSIINSIKTKKVYLTIDIDGLDPSYAPATGTPVPGGIEWDYMLKLVRELMKKKDLVGADIVEITPQKDDVLTQYTAAQLTYNIISYKLLKDKKKLKFYGG